MTVDEMIRAASTELRHATETHTIPPPRFAATPPSPAPRRRLALIGIAVVVAAAVTVGVVVHADDTDAPSKIDTTGGSTTSISVTTTEDDEPPPSFAPPPSELPNYIGAPSVPSEALERWGASVVFAFEPGVTDPTTGRIIRQDPPGGTPFAAGMTVTFTIGPRLAVLDGEVDLGSGVSASKGAWRVIASSVMRSATDTDYAIGFFTAPTVSTWGGTPDLTKITRRDLADPRVAFGTAPFDAVSIQLLEQTGIVIGSVATKRIENVDKPPLSYWLIELDKYSSFETLRAVDRNGNVLAEHPQRVPGK
jgi:hypothetical protein